MRKSILVSTLIILSAALIEATIFSNIVALPAIPDISLIVVLYLAINNGSTYGELAGFGSGLILDFLSAGPFGLNCIIRTLLGYVAGIFHKRINSETFPIQCFLGFITTILKGLIIFILSFLYKNTVLPYKPISLMFLIELGMNTVLTPLLFLFLNLFRRSLILNPETEI